MGLSAAGFTIPSGDEILDLMVTEFENLTGLTVDRTNTHDQFVMVMFVIFTEHLVATLELAQALYDGTKVDSAEGIQLEDATYLVGIEPDPATYSSATVSLTGTAGVIVPVGSIVEGGGVDGKARWTLTEAVTIPGDGVVVAQEAGPIEADAAVIDKVITGVPGWSAVSNADAANPGRLREGGASLRRRRRIGLQAGGASSRASLRSCLLAYDFIEECVVIENPSNVAATVSGKSMDPNSVWVFLTPDTLTDDQTDTVAAAIHRKLAAGTELMADGGPTTVAKLVLDAGESTGRTIQWDYGSDLATTLTATVTLRPGYVLADVSQAIQDAMADYFDTLGMGDALRSYDLILATAGIEGIAAISFTASVGALPYTPGIDETLTLTSTTVV